MRPERAQFSTMTMRDEFVLGLGSSLISKKIGSSAQALP